MKFLWSLVLVALISPTSAAVAEQIITIPPGHDMRIVIDAPQAPLGQRWKIAAWGQRDGVQLPVPGGWMPPAPEPRWSQLIYQEQTSFQSSPSHKEIFWPRQKNALTIVFDAWAYRNGEYVSLDRINIADNDHTVVAFDRVQDSHALNHSRHYDNMFVTVTYDPPLSADLKAAK